jgi:hypothetical protein
VVELRAVVAESVGDVLRRGAGEGQVTVLYEAVNGTDVTSRGRWRVAVVYPSAAATRVSL